MPSINRNFAWAFIVFWGILVSSPPGFAQGGWEKISGTPPEAGYVTLSKNSADNGLIFLATGRNLYRTPDQGKRWESILELTGRGEILEVQSGQDRLFLVTDREINVSPDQGKTWEKLPLPAGVDKITTFERHPRDEEILFLGTGHGLYWSLDSGGSWARQAGNLGEKTIRHIFISPEEGRLLLVATDDDLYRSDNWGGSFARSFHLARESGQEEENETGSLPGNEILSGGEPVSGGSPFRAIKSSGENPAEFFLGTSRGAFVSYDTGRTWLSLPRSGLASKEVLDLEVSRDRGTVFASTPEGVFRFERHEQRWREMFEGMLEKKFGNLDLLAGPQDELLALSKDGLFRWQGGGPPPSEVAAQEYRTISQYSADNLLDLFSKEPTVGDVQRAAIRYNDVGNGKIQRWHAASRLKALVPDISINKGLSTHNTIDMDRGGTNDRDFYVLGPDSTSRSDSLNFGWDLKDLVWSTDQTSIDSREKLMVELREDIVSEVTRLYFERRRLLMELFLNRPAAKKDYLESLLRIDEITSYIDGLTDGYLSKELKNRDIKYA